MSARPRVFPQEQRRAARVIAIRPRAQHDGGTFVGTLVGVVSWGMLFVSVLAAVNRARAGAVWPPAGTPDLPTGIAFVAAVAMTLGGGALLYALYSLERARTFEVQCGVGVAFLIGVLALHIQRLLLSRAHHEGLRASTTYGAAVYGVVTLHLVHLVGVVVALGWVYNLARQEKLSPLRRPTLRLIVALWCMLTVVWWGACRVLFA